MSALAVIRHIDRVELASWICLAWGYDLKSGEECMTLAELRAFASPAATSQKEDG